MSELHWEDVHRRKTPEEVSWFQAHPTHSLALLDAARAQPRASIVDVGGGASRFVDSVLARGHRDVTVLDISPSALDRARARLGPAAAAAVFVVKDVTAWRPGRTFDVWHDRACFHFLDDEPRRRAYVDVLAAAIAPGGHAILATFAEDGPTSCSALPVRRYTPASLSAELAGVAALVEVRREVHTTPWGAPQPFLFACFQRV